MQKKNNFLTKFVKKDYNNRLEEILSQKNFSEEVKNTLLSIFYKIENGYKDYNTVKKETFEKKEYIEKLINIIDKDCEKIEFVKDENAEEVVDNNKKEIICAPIENKILYCLAKIQKRNIVVKYNDDSIEKALSFMLNTGNNINIVEPLRDFNGFSWNIIEKDIEDLDYNLLYQNIIFLMGNKFADKWVNNYEPLVDYFDLFQSEIERKYGKKLKENIVKSIIRISLGLMANYNVDFRNKIIEKSNELEQKYFEIEDKEKYLIKISKNKKQKEKEIRELDKIINDKNLLVEEYEKRNKRLPLEKKIFSIRVLKNQLKKERENLIKKIEDYNNLMNPKYFLENKRKIEKMYKYFEKIGEIDVQSEIIKLQKDIIRCMYIEIQNIEDRNELINFIYKFRYYNLLPMSNKTSIYQKKELKILMKKLTEAIINKGIELKVINKIVKDEETNYNITKDLLLSKIIALEDIGLKAFLENEKVVITIYDEEIEENQIELEKLNQKDLKIKLGKKTKLFI